MHLGILTSHPIQYQAPWFRRLAEKVELEVFFAHRQSAAEQGQSGFGLAFNWDVDLLSGYRHLFLRNRAVQPSVDRFTGCDTPEIRELIRQKQFDAFVVYGWYLKSHWQAVRACRHFGVPVLARGDSQLQTPRSHVKRWLKEIGYRIVLHQFDGFLTVGQRNREYLLHYGASPERIFPAPHFVDNVWFARKAAEVSGQRSAVRGQWGANDHTLVALFVGKFIPKKRPGDLLEALARLRGQYQDFLAVFIGSGELETALREQVNRLEVNARFEGFKNQSELPACYTSADVLVLPSDGGETWGLVVNEAMACGIPAVVSDAVGCAPDLILEGETGFNFPVGDIDQLADRLSRLAELKRQGHDFGPGLARTLGRYSVEAAVSGTLQAAETLATMKAKASKA